MPLLMSVMTSLLCSCSGGAGGFGSNKKETAANKDPGNKPAEDSKQLNAEKDQASAPAEVAGAFLVRQKFDATRSTESNVLVNVYIAKAEAPTTILKHDDVDAKAFLLFDGEEEQPVRIGSNSDLTLGTYTYLVKPSDVPDGKIKLVLNSNQPNATTITKPLKDIAPGVNDELSFGLVATREMAPVAGGFGRATLANNLERGDFQPAMFCEDGKIDPDPNSSLSRRQGLSGTLKDLLANTGGFGPVKSPNFVWYPNKNWIKNNPKACFYKGKTDTDIYLGMAQANGCYIFLVRPNGERNDSRMFVTREALVDKQAVQEIKEVIDAHACQ